MARREGPLQKSVELKVKADFGSAGQENEFIDAVSPSNPSVCTTVSRSGPPSEPRKTRSGWSLF